MFTIVNTKHHTILTSSTHLLLTHTISLTSILMLSPPPWQTSKRPLSKRSYHQQSVCITCLPLWATCPNTLQPPSWCSCLWIRLCLWTAATNRPVVHLQMIYEHGAIVEWYWQGKTKKLGEKLVPVQLFPPQIPLWLTWVYTQASTVKGQWITTWAMAWPLQSPWLHSLF
jgi:hypothetical protein